MSPANVDAERRLLLQGLLGSGVAGYVGASAASTSSHGESRGQSRVSLVIDDSPMAGAFRRGAETGLPAQAMQVFHARLDARRLDAVTVELHRPGRRLLGLVDDAFAVLLVDAARGSGAHLRWQGEFVVPTGGAPGWAEHLGRRLVLLGGDEPTRSPLHDPAGDGPSRHVVCLVIDTREERIHGRR